MNTVPSLLEEFAAYIRDLSEASGSVVVLHLEPLEPENLLLAACGESSVPEFEDAATAWAYLSDHLGAAGGVVTDIRQQPSSDPDCQLICIPLTHVLPRPEQTQIELGERRATPVVRSAPELDGKLWIGLAEPKSADVLGHLLEGFGNDADLAEGEQRWLARFISLSTRLAWQAYHLSRSLHDPITRLPGRRQFETFLSRALAGAKESSQPLSLLLVNPDDFVMVNHRFGREQGDLAVREIADRLAGCIRETDGVFRYGGAAFSIVLPATDLEQAGQTASKIRSQLTGQAFLNGKLELEFTIGGAVTDQQYLAQEKPDKHEIVRLADRTLNQAKLSGGGQTQLNGCSEMDGKVNHFDPLNGIFTTDSERDYRNMLLLWEAVTLVTTTQEPDDLAQTFVEKLGYRFKPDRLAMIQRDVDEALHVVATSVRSHDSEEGRTADVAFRLTTTEQRLIRSALGSRQIESIQADGQSRGEKSRYAVPLMSGGKATGCLLLDGLSSHLDLDSTDLMFLSALANQLAIALERAELSVRWIREKDQESRQLRDEVQGLREAMNPHRPIYESAQMVEQMQVVKRIAPTDATVLIIGESGTGKEMLAHSIHAHSTRADQAMVTVDCGAISHGLIEAELFGHVKGAYTGAESASEGRIVQADGGTLFLDEIGELPLGVQAKLLRFVQEREFVPVGGHEVRRVDVRIVAATNRELKNEVTAGRFRRDLYYRLQVVPLRAYPLRERPDDILPLADAFLSRFALQYQSKCSGFTANAERLLLAHDWPGNVRELRNTILRAVLLSNSVVIDADGIKLLPEAEEFADEHAGEVAAESAISTQVAEQAGVEETLPPMALLERSLAEQVQSALEVNARRPVPLGRWLQEDLILAINESSAGVIRKGARLAGVPESTFRRQLDKASADRDAGLAIRNASWERMALPLSMVVKDLDELGESDVFEQARECLLKVIEQAVGRRVSVGAALMGVSPPTYKRLLQAQAA